MLVFGLERQIMNSVVIMCDRCGKIVDGECYDVTSGTFKCLQRWEEEGICKKCLVDDPKYHQIFNIGNE